MFRMLLLLPLGALVGLYANHHRRTHVGTFMPVLIAGICTDVLVPGSLSRWSWSAC